MTSWYSSSCRWSWGSGDRQWSRGGEIAAVPAATLALCSLQYRYARRFAAKLEHKIQYNKKLQWISMGRNSYSYPFAVWCSRQVRWLGYYLYKSPNKIAPRFCSKYLKSKSLIDLTNLRKLWGWSNAVSDTLGAKKIIVFELHCGVEANMLSRTAIWFLLTNPVCNLYSVWQKLYSIT